MALRYCVCRPFWALWVVPGRDDMVEIDVRMHSCVFELEGGWPICSLASMTESKNLEGSFWVSELYICSAGFRTNNV